MPCENCVFWQPEEDRKEGECQAASAAVLTKMRAASPHGYDGWLVTAPSFHCSEWKWDYRQERY